MNNLNFTAVAPTVGLNFGILAVVIAVGLTFSLGVMTKSMSDNEYQFLNKNIKTEYKAAKTRCTLLSSGENNKCVVKAVAEKKKSKAELDAKFKEPIDTQADSGIAKADSEFLVDMQKCNSKFGHGKVLCKKTARVARDKEIDNANAQMRLRLLKADLLKNEKPAYSSSMTVLDKLPSTFKKSRLI